MFPKQTQQRLWLLQAQLRYGIIKPLWNPSNQSHNIHHIQSTSGIMYLHVFFHVSINMVVACVRQMCGYHTNHSTTFILFFWWFMYISTCVLYHTSLRILLHTGFTDTWHFVSSTFSSEDADDALAARTAITNPSPRCWSCCLVSEWVVCVFMYVWVYAFEILSVRLFFP